ncbi:acylphosphatase [Neptunomonas sp.]|uniref:acylphosphatase n=1 Tax=Neptunomonas sp. TaxID=1971898 RepID=UPI0025F9077F|nr:acylphosphatase [Neptunomonas sp.]
MTKICVNAFVTGKVQGVWFRKSTMDQALSHGLSGWVKNLSDGRVEVMLCGESNAVRQVEAWLQIGPALASVAQVTSESLPYDEGLNGFVMQNEESEG